MNTRPGYSPPNPEPEPVVEVPAQGLFVVDGGEVTEVSIRRRLWARCYCKDDRHAEDKIFGYTLEEGDARDDVTHRAECDTCPAAHLLRVERCDVVSEVRA